MDENVDRSEGPGEKWNGRQSDERPQMNVMRQRRWGKRKTKGDRQKEEWQVEIRRKSKEKQKSTNERKC